MAPPAWTIEFETLEGAIEVLFKYLANRVDINDNCHYQIVKITSESIINTENVTKKKLSNLI